MMEELKCLMMELREINEATPPPKWWGGRSFISASFIHYFLMGLVTIKI